MGEGAAEEDDKAGKAQGQREGQRRVAQWVRDYSRLPGIPDEFLGPDGKPRAVWSRFFDAFGALAPDEIERRFAMADRHLREAGVTYRAPGDSAAKASKKRLQTGRGAPSGPIYSSEMPGSRA